MARFAAPVLAEQAQVLQRTHHFTYTKPRLGPSTQPLAESVAWNLADRGVVLSGDEFDDAWSAFRQGDGLWVVRVSYVSRKRSQHADWVADLSEGTLTAVNRVATELGYVEPGRVRPPGLRPLKPAVAARPVRPTPAPTTSSRSVAAAAMAAAAARSAAAADAARAVPPSPSSSPGSYAMPPRSSSPSGPAGSPGADAAPRSGDADTAASKRQRPLVAPTRRPAGDPAGRPAERRVSGRKVSGATKPSGEATAKRPPRPSPGTGEAAPSSGTTSRQANVDKSLRPSLPARGSSNGGSRPLFARSPRRDPPAPAPAGREAGPSTRRSSPAASGSGSERQAAPAGSGQSSTPRRAAGPPSGERVRAVSGPRPSGDRVRAASGPSTSSGSGPEASTAPPGAIDRPRPSAARSMSTADRFGPLAGRAASAPRPTQTAGRDREPSRRTAAPATSAEQPRRRAAPSSRASEASRRSAAAGPAPRRAEPPVRAPRTVDPAAPAPHPVVSTPIPATRAARPASPRPVRADRPLAAPGRPRRQRPLVAPGRQPSGANPAATPASAEPVRRPAPAVDPNDRVHRPASEPDTAPVPVVVAPPSWPSPDAGPVDEGIVLIKAGQAGVREDDRARDPFEGQWRDADPKATGERPRPGVGRKPAPPVAPARTARAERRGYRPIEPISM